MDFLIPLCKVDEERRLIHGRAIQEIPDRSGEIIDYATAKPAFEEWSKSFEDATGGLSKGNLRVMHGQSVAGKVIDISYNDTEKAIDIVAKVVDDNEWKKVLEGCYTGFSVGGKYARKWDDSDGRKRYTPKVAEMSLVDRPCIPSAKFFELQKADGTLQKVEFKAEPEPEQFRFSEDLIKRLKDRVDGYNEETNEGLFLAKLHRVKQVFQRGVAAFERAPVEGKTSEDYGFGRVDMYLGNLAKMDGESHDPDLLPDQHPLHKAYQLKKSAAQETVVYVSFGDLYKADGRKGRDGDGDGKFNEDGEGGGQAPARDTSAKDDRSNIAVIPERRFEAAGTLLNIGIPAAIGAVGGAAFGAGSKDPVAGPFDAAKKWMSRKVGGGVVGGAMAMGATVSRGVSDGARFAEKKLKPAATSASADIFDRAAVRAARAVRAGGVMGAKALLRNSAAASAKGAAGAEKIADAYIAVRDRALRGLSTAYRAGLGANKSRTRSGIAIGLAATGGAAIGGMFGAKFNFLGPTGAMIDPFLGHRVIRTNEVGKGDMQIDLEKSAYTFGDLYKWDESKVRRDEEGKFTFKEGAALAAGGAAVAAAAILGGPRAARAIAAAAPNASRAVGNAAQIAAQQGKAALKTAAASGAAAAKWVGSTVKDFATATTDKVAETATKTLADFKQKTLRQQIAEAGAAVGVGALIYNEGKDIFQQIKDGAVKLVSTVDPTGVNTKFEGRDGKELFSYHTATGAKYKGVSIEGTGAVQAVQQGQYRSPVTTSPNGKIEDRQYLGPSASTRIDAEKSKASQEAHRIKEVTDKLKMRLPAQDLADEYNKVRENSNFHALDKYKILNSMLGSGGSPLTSLNAADVTDGARMNQVVSAIESSLKSSGGKFTSGSHKQAAYALIEATTAPEAYKAPARIQIGKMEVGNFGVVDGRKGRDGDGDGVKDEAKKDSVPVPASVAAKVQAMASPQGAAVNATGRNSAQAQISPIWEVVNGMKEQGFDPTGNPKKRFTESTWKQFERNPANRQLVNDAKDAYDLFLESVNDDLAEEFAQSKGTTLKSDGPKTFGDLYKADGRAGRDADGDGLKDEADKKKAGSAQAARPFAKPGSILDRL